MNRSHKILTVCHCILNPNAKIYPLAEFQGVHPAVIPFMNEGTGLFQLPCPELSYLGGKRWGMTREQYDVPLFKRHCRNILEPCVDQLESLVKTKCRITGIMGMDGSPNCGVNYTCGGYAGGSIMDQASVASQVAAYKKKRGKGVFMEVLFLLLQERGLKIPFLSVEETLPSSSLSKTRS